MRSLEPLKQSNQPTQMFCLEFGSHLDGRYTRSMQSFWLFQRSIHSQQNTTKNDIQSLAPNIKTTYAVKNGQVAVIFPNHQMLYKKFLCNQFLFGNSHFWDDWSTVKWQDIQVNYTVFSFSQIYQCKHITWHKFFITCVCFWLYILLSLLCFNIRTSTYFCLFSILCLLFMFQSNRLLCSEIMMRKWNQSKNIFNSFWPHIFCIICFSLNLNAT